MDQHTKWGVQIEGPPLNGQLACACAVLASSALTFSSRPAETVGGSLLASGPPAVQHTRRRCAPMGPGLLLQLGDPPGEPGAQGAGPAAVLTASFHLDTRSQTADQ